MLIRGPPSAILELTRWNLATRVSLQFRGRTPQRLLFQFRDGCGHEFRFNFGTDATWPRKFRPNFGVDATGPREFRLNFGTGAETSFVSISGRGPTWPRESPLDLGTDAATSFVSISGRMKPRHASFVQISGRVRPGQAGLTTISGRMQAGHASFVQISARMNLDQPSFDYTCKMAFPYGSIWCATPFAGDFKNNRSTGAGTVCSYPRKLQNKPWIFD